MEKNYFHLFFYLRFIYCIENKTEGVRNLPEQKRQNLIEKRGDRTVEHWCLFFPECGQGEMWAICYHRNQPKYVGGGGKAHSRNLKIVLLSKLKCSSQ